MEKGRKGGQSRGKGRRGAVGEQGDIDLHEHRAGGKGEEAGTEQGGTEQGKGGQRRGDEGYVEQLGDGAGAGTRKVEQWESRGT